MTILGIFSAKGGVGSSILATNLACALTHFGTVALLDLHPCAGCDDLLLNLTPGHTWKELLPVATELKPRHFELARTLHPTGLELYAAPEQWDGEASGESVARLVEAIHQRMDWLILDLPVGINAWVETMLSLMHLPALVTTADLVALRATRRLYGQLPEYARDRTWMVLNQFTKRHPVKPRQLADAMGIKLIATLPSDVAAVGYQVNFGLACVLDPRSRFGRSVSAFADRLSQNHRVNVEDQVARSES